MHDEVLDILLLTIIAEPEKSRFDVVTTLFGRQQRCYNVETTSCAYWEMFRFISNPILGTLDHGPYFIKEVKQNL